MYSFLRIKKFKRGDVFPVLREAQRTPAIHYKKGVDFDSFEKHLLYILMFSRQYPDSGSVKTMLSDIDKRIEEHLKSFEEKNIS